LSLEIAEIVIECQVTVTLKLQILEVSLKYCSVL